jgi:hypothetical protein
MFSIEYDEIELEWHGQPPPVMQSEMERMIRQELRAHIVPLTPDDLCFFIQFIGLIVMVFGVKDSTAYHCMWL